MADIKAAFDSYAERLARAMKLVDADKLAILADAIRTAWAARRQVFFCGNGGSAGNAIHLANDMIYGIGKAGGLGLRVEALPANTSVITCLANDLGYDEIFAQQLRVKADKDDVLVVLSGSGNSPNVVKALEVGNALGMKTFAILGYSGGRCAKLAQVPLHIAVDDMQVSEDLQLIIGHVCMQWLCANPV